MIILVRLVLTVLLVLWAVLPFFDDSGGGGTLEEIFSLGIFGSIIIVAAFFIMVAFYCRTLQRCLALLKPENRRIKPSSVWYMFAIPFNFVEDFFIVIQLASSLEAEKKANAKLKNINDFGLVPGIGWAIAQILSFIPGTLGQIAGVTGMIFVIFHWVLIARITRALLENRAQKEERGLGITLL